MYLISEIKAGFKEVEAKEGADKKTVFAAGTIFGLLAVYFYFKMNMVATILTVSAAFLFICSGILGGLFLRNVYIFWMKISVVLGAVMSRILLTAIFFLVVTPVAFISGILGKDPLNIKRKTIISGYWQNKSQFSDNYIKKY